MRFTHIDVNFDIRYEGHQNCPKILSINILRVFSDHHLWCQNRRQYLWTSLCQFNFFVNLLHSLGVWIFDIWHLFDNLTSFWKLDIFLTTWHLFDILAHYLNHLSSSLARGQGGVKGYMWLSMPHTPIPIANVAHMSCTLYPCTPYPCTLFAPCGPHPLYPLPMYPVPHTLVPYCPIYPYCPYSLYPIAPLPMWLIPTVPHTLYPTAPYAHTPVPHTPYPIAPCGPHPCAPYPLYPLPIPHTHLYPHYPVSYHPLYPIPHLCYCPIAHVPMTPVPHWAIGHMGNEGNGVQGVWVTWAMGPMGNEDTGGNGV